MRTHRLPSPHCRTTDRRSLPWMRRLKVGLRPRASTRRNESVWTYVKRRFAWARPQAKNAMTPSPLFPPSTTERARVAPGRCSSTGPRGVPHPGPPSFPTTRLVAHKPHRGALPRGGGASPATRECAPEGGEGGESNCQWSPEGRATERSQEVIEMMANVLEGLVAPKSPGAKCRVPDGSKPGAGSKGPGIGAIRSSCTITSERYPAQSVQGAPVCARLTGEMLMCSTTPANSTDSVDETTRAERPSRCPPGGVMRRPEHSAPKPPDLSLILDSTGAFSPTLARGCAVRVNLPGPLAPPSAARRRCWRC